MSKFEELGLAAETLYVKKNCTLDQISDQLGISVQTASRWKRAGRWDEKRFKFRATPGAAVDLLEDILRSKAEELRDTPAQDIGTKATDALVKLVASINKLKREEDIRVQAINVMDEFGKYIQRSDLNDKQKEFITKVMNGFFTYLRDA